MACDHPARQAVLDEGVPEAYADKALAVKQRAESDPALAAFDWLSIIAAFKKWGPVVFDILEDLLGGPKS
jgi:hypothetical protein